MAFTTYYGPNTIVTETCLWVADGHRRICITYTYNVSNGILTYAASVYRCEVTEYDQHTIGVSEPTHEQMLGHVHTTTRRFEIRPVIILVATKLTYDQILKTIRREMCHGYGCKGPRMLASAFDMDCGASDGGSDSSGNTWLSEGAYDEDAMDVDYETDRDEWTQDDWDTHLDNIHKIQRKTLRKLRYFSAGKVENYKGERVRVMREFFITFKADKKTGALIYGAAISRRPEELGPITDKDLIDEHFKTAAARLDYRPVTMFVSEEFRDQLRSKPMHREDVMYEILDVILSRPGGKFLIREDW
jgi:hypothetical protein